MADYRYAVGTVASDRTGPLGVQTIDVSDANGIFTPKAVLMWGTAQNADGFTDNAYFFMGASDGTTEFSAGCWADTGQASPSIDWTNLITNTSFLTIPQNNTQTTTAYSASTVTFLEGSFSFTWSASADTDPFDLHYIVFGGLDLGAEVGLALDAVTTPAVVATSVSLPNPLTALLTFGVPGTGPQVYAIPSFTNGSWPNVGMVDADLNQGVVGTELGPTQVADSFHSNGGQYEDATHAQTKIGANRAVVTLAAATVLGTGTFSMDYSVVDSPTAWTPGAGFFYLAISGPRVIVGSANAPTAAAPQSQTLTTTFNPGAVLAATTGLAPSGSVAVNVGFSFGAATPLAQCNTWIGMLEGQVTSSTSRGRFMDRLITMAAPTTAEGQTVVATGAAAFDGTSSPTVEWDLTNGTARRFLYAVFEGAVVPPAPPNPGEEVTFPIRCVRIGPTVSSDGKRLRVVRFELDAMVGQGNADCPNPTIRYRSSWDNGSTWSDDREGSMGRVGQYLTKVRWWQNGAGYNWTPQLIFDAPVDVCFVRAFIEIEGWDH